VPLFRYHATARDGKKTSGIIDADSIEIAKEKVYKQQLFLTKIRSVEHRYSKSSVDTQFLLSFTRELKQLIKAGLPLYESLITIQEKYAKHRSHPLLLDLCTQIKGGSLLSKALHKYPHTFNPVYIALISTGEASGNLAFSLEELLQLLLREQKVKKQLLSSLLYPSFLFGFCLIVIFTFLFFVIPSMKELFDGKNLHPLTRIVLGVSRWATEHTFTFFSMFLFPPLSLWVSQFHRKGKILKEKILLKIPFLNTLLLQSAIIRFCRSTSILLRGGIPLIPALTLAKKGTRHGLLEHIIEKATEKVGQGERMSIQFQNTSILPPLMGRMMAIAEETGNLGQMLQDIAEIYDEDLEKRLALIHTFMQPALLILLGTLIGIILLSILIPLTDVGAILY